MRVYLAEKKQQGETIAQFLDSSVKIDRHDNATHYKLSNGDVVCWCQGHLYGLAMPDYYSPELKQWKLETLPFRPQQWKLVITPAGKKLMPVITRELDRADEVVLCSDFDREGQYLGLNAIKEADFTGRILRAPVTALGKVELQRAFDRVEDISKTMSLYYSALARSHADYLVGINLTRFFSCLGAESSYKDKVNIGRVITPTINLIVQRDLDIANFKSKSYYDLKVLLSVQKGQFTVKWNIPKELLDSEGYLTNFNVAQAAMVKVKGKPFTIINVDKKKVSQQPPLPFSLSDLQVYCGEHFKLSPDRTLEIVQKLYDEQYTTYPRTDSSYLPESQHSDAPVIIAQLSKDPSFMQLAQGCDTSLKSQAFSDKKMGNSSHNAIIPTMEYKDPSRLATDEFKVYDAIRRRYIAQFYVPAQFDAVQVTAECQGEFFSAGGRTLKVAGYRMVYSEELLDDKNDPTDEELAKIPPLAVGEIAVPQDFKLESKKTRAPKRYVQHTLAKAMRHIDTLVEDPQQKAILKETKGIGTEATRAGIIKNLFDFGWVTEDSSKKLHATPKAHEIMTIIPRELKSPVMTALWENELEKISEDKLNYVSFENKIFSWVTQLIKVCSQPKALEVIHNQFSKIAKEENPTTSIQCPFCQSPLKMITGKDKQKYWVCTNKDNCKFITSDNLGTPVLEFCPKCNSLLRRYKYKDKKEHFWKCSNEACGAFYKDISGKPLHELPECPRCHREMRFSGNYDREGKKQTPYFYCVGYKDKSCFCKLDKNFKEIRPKAKRAVHK